MHTLSFFARLSPQLGSTDALATIAAATSGAAIFAVIALLQLATTSLQRTCSHLQKTKNFCCNLQQLAAIYD